ncbi:MAG: hypothetical protein WA971_00280, partial [Microbacterium sp.]
MAFAMRRAGRHAGRLSLIALIVGLVVTGVGGIDAVTGRMLAAGASRILADAEPAARTVLVVATEAPDAGAQDSQVRAAIAAAFAGTDVVVSRQSAVEASVETAGADVTLRLLDDDRLPDLAVLTGGAWPQAPDRIALPDAAVGRQGLRIGDTVALAGTGTSFTVVGTWTAKDPADPAWHGDPAVASGEDDGAIGPAIVGSGGLEGLPDTPTITWEIAPAGVGLSGIPALQRALATLRGLPDALDPQHQEDTRIVGGLGDTVQRQAVAVGTTRGLLVAPLLIIALLGVLVLGIVLITLQIARGDELVLLRARGASGRSLALGAATEAGLLSGAGA